MKNSICIFLLLVCFVCGNLYCSNTDFAYVVAREAQTRERLIKTYLYKINLDTKKIVSTKEVFCSSSIFTFPRWFLKMSSSDVLIGIEVPSTVPIRSRNPNKYYGEPDVLKIVKIEGMEISKSMAIDYDVEPNPIYLPYDKTIFFDGRDLTQNGKVGHYVLSFDKKYEIEKTKTLKEKEIFKKVCVSSNKKYLCRYFPELSSKKYLDIINTETGKRIKKFIYKKSFGKILDITEFPHRKGLYILGYDYDEESDTGNLLITNIKSGKIVKSVKMKGLVNTIDTIQDGSLFYMVIDYWLDVGKKQKPYVAVVDTKNYEVITSTSFENTIRIEKISGREYGRARELHEIFSTGVSKNGKYFVVLFSGLGSSVRMYVPGKVLIFDSESNKIDFITIGVDPVHNLILSE